MLDQISFIIYSDKLDIKVYQSQHLSNLEIANKQEKNICLECGNDHSFKGNIINRRTSFDYFQELIDNHNKKQKLKKVKNCVRY